MDLWVRAVRCLPRKNHLSVPPDAKLVLHPISLVHSLAFIVGLFDSGFRIFGVGVIRSQHGTAIDHAGILDFGIRQTGSSFANETRLRYVLAASDGSRFINSRGCCFNWLA